MKKILLTIIAIMEVIMLTSCVNKTTEEITDDNYTITTQDATTKEDESSSTTSVNTKLFSNVEIPDEINQYETTIFSLKEVTDGYIKSSYNPYKTESIFIDAVFTDSLNNEYYRPAYWTQDYNIKLNTLSHQDSYVFSDELKGTDSAIRKGIEHFNVSFKPLSSGSYNYNFKVFVNNVLKEELNGTFNVSASSNEYKGKIVVNDTNKRYFMYDNTKETYVAVGMNNAWYSSNSRKSYDYDEWFKRMSANGCNFSRIWMASWSFGLHIGSAAKVDDFTGRLAQAARLERVLGVAEDYGIYIFLTLNNHGQFSTNVNPEWTDNTYSSILDKPYQFWTDDNAKKLYKDELRYIVARFGTYDSILAYELFNEVDWTQSSAIYDQKIKLWHDEMAKYIRSIDCYDRLITTSYKGTLGSAMSLDSIDIANVHTYDFTNQSPFSGCRNLINTNYRNYNKIMLLAEWGVNASSGYETYTIDKDGITLYQALWSSILSGASGTAMNWWWDQYIHKYDLYKLYKGVGEFAKHMNLNGEIVYLDKANATIDSDLSFIGIKADDRVYGYIYDISYSRNNPSVRSFTTSFSMNYKNGEYDVTIMNPRTGEIIKIEKIQVTNNTISFEIGTFNTDIALIIE